MSSAAWRRDWMKRNPDKRREYERRKREKNPEKYAAIRLRATRKFHGYPEPTRPCPTVCECCKKPSDKALALDHDHETGAFRGWLCHKCNLGIGRLGDTIEALEEALAYLRRAKNEHYD